MVGHDGERTGELASGLDGPRFYDDDEVFTTYQRHRARDETPNDTLEKPDLLDLIGEAAGLQ
ncbi:MAG: hypothetical protein AB7K36_17205, partial [Chloroflexota bacterium]